MAAKTRFLNSIITSAESHDISMPWSRGPARRASIARSSNQRQSTDATRAPAIKTA